MIARAWILLGAVLVSAPVLTGCGAPPEQPAVDSAASAFATAVIQRDGARACALLTQNAAEAASGATDTPCAKAVLNVQESGADIHGVQVWGDAAQVKVGGDVVFLRRLAVGWRVAAAGCKPQSGQPGLPYTCDVES